MQRFELVGYKEVSLAADAKLAPVVSTPQPAKASQAQAAAAQPIQVQSPQALPQSAAAELDWPSGGSQWTHEWRQSLPVVRGIHAPPLRKWPAPFDKLFEFEDCGFRFQARWRRYLMSLRFITLLLPLFVSSVCAAEPADLIVTNGLVVTMNEQRELITSGAVVVRGDRIVAVGPATIASDFTAARTIDAAGGIVMPGMINTHTHVAMTVFRGLGDDVADRLRRYIWPLEAKVVNADLVYWGAMHGLVEMVEGGVTTFVDSYPHPESTARAAKEVGIRGVVTYGVKDDLAPARKFAEEYRDDPLIIPAIGLHSPYDNTAEQIKQAALLAKELDLRVSMHVSEMDFELEQLRKKYHQTPIEYLNSLGLLSPRLLAAHCIFLTDGDIALLKANDVGVAHNMVAESGQGF